MILPRAILVLAILVIAAALVVNVASGQDIDFGDDTSEWANDGECDDPRFTGPGAFAGGGALLIDVLPMTDATDCRRLFERGEIRLVETWEPPPDETCEAMALRDDRYFCWVETDNQPGCWVLTERLAFGNLGTVNWSGSCQEGRAQGAGTAEWNWVNNSGRPYNSLEQGVYTNGIRQGEWSSHVTTTGYREGITLRRRRDSGRVLGRARRRFRT